MDGALNGYRLRSAHGDTIDPRQPLPVDTVEAQETSSVSPTLTYNGKAAAGAISVSSVALKPIIEDLGSRVGSYWGEIQNKVYSALADGSSGVGDHWVTEVVETNGSATVSIYDPNKNLEEMFESVTGTVKRFIAKVYDKSGGTLYGWIRGIAAPGNDLYVFDIFNNRLTEGNQNWVGTLTSFDHTAIVKVEIYFYNSSLAFGTGTCFLEEVECPREYSKNRATQLEYAETLSNGQFFVDYMRGDIIGSKADATASEVVTYNIWASTAGGSTGPSANVDLKKIAGTIVKVNGGAKNAGTQTVVLATDDPAVTLLGTIDTDTGAISTALGVTATAPTSFRSATVDETAAQAVKAAAGTLYGFNIYNPNAYDVFVKLYNTAAASVVVGTTATVQTIQVPAVGSVYVKQDQPIQAFATAIAVAATKLYADSDTTALDTDALVQLFYK